jgi:hypothetical protein
MAKYTLVDDRLVEGRHIWCAKGVKAFGDVFIAWHDGTWQIQHEEAFGQPRGFLFVHDMAPTPVRRRSRLTRTATSIHFFRRQPLRSWHA